MRYSTGSSTVMILRLRSLANSSAVYKVVLLPEPVGPVTSTMPLASWVQREKSALCSAFMPRSCRRVGLRSWRSRRSTMDSPSTPGSTDTRMSKASPCTRALMRPSCGSRRSAMSNSARILMRQETASKRSLGWRANSCMSPSTRRRTAKSCSSGSTCKSEARRVTASDNMPFTNSMVGPSSASSRSRRRSSLATASVGEAIRRFWATCSNRLGVSTAAVSGLLLCCSRRSHSAQTSGDTSSRTPNCQACSPSDTSRPLSISQSGLSPSSVQARRTASASSPASVPSAPSRGSVSRSA
jgi:hypothetical protein